MSKMDLEERDVTYRYDKEGNRICRDCYEKPEVDSYIRCKRCYNLHVGYSYYIDVKDKNGCMGDVSK